MKRLAIFLLLTARCLSQMSGGGSFSQGGTLSTGAVANPLPTIQSFSCSPATISSGSTSLCSAVVINAGTTAGSITISNGLFSCGAGCPGTINVTTPALTMTTTYILSATNVNGTVTAPFTVTVGAIPTASISPSPTSINLNTCGGMCTTLVSWTATNQNTVKIVRNSDGFVELNCLSSCPSISNFTDSPLNTTTYTITVVAVGGGTVSVTSVTVTVTPLTSSGADNKYVNIGDVPKAGNPVSDGPATFPLGFYYTALNGTPSPGTIRTVTDNTSMAAALAAVACGDQIVVTAGTVLNPFNWPILNCDTAHYITIRSSGTTDPNFPPEGTRATPCIANVTSIPGGTDFPCPTPRQLMFKVVATVANQSPIKVVSCITWPISGGPADTPPGSNVDVPCAHSGRLIGAEVTKPAGLAMNGQLISFDGGDHMIVDRSWIHGENDTVAWSQNSATQNGVHVNGTYLAVIDSWINAIVCVQPGGCVDSQGIEWGTNNFYNNVIKVVNNEIEASGEPYFAGGGSAPFLCVNPYSLPDAHCVPTDFEVRRNHTVHNWLWMLPVKPNIAGNGYQHPDPKNLGEFKIGDRILLEGNICERSHTGWQGDQFGNCNLLTPKNQANKQIGSFGTISVDPAGGGDAHKVINTGGTFVCDLDQRTTSAYAATCPDIVVFSGQPGSYIKTCPLGVGGCPLIIGGTTYHAVTWSDSTHLTLLENLTTPGVMSQYCKRGQDQFAAVYNVTDRYGIARHTTDFMEIAGALSDCGDANLGIHNVSVHDLEAVDVDATFFNNAPTSTCCNEGWGFKFESATTDNTTAPSSLSFRHNSLAVKAWANGHNGLIKWFDQRYNTTTAPSLAAYFASIEVLNNISTGPFTIEAGSGIGTNFLALNAPNCGTGGNCAAPHGPVSQGIAIYASPSRNGTGLTANIQRNLTLQGIVAGQLNDTPDLNLLSGAWGVNTVEACSCTSGGSNNCAGNIWTHPVNSGDIDACDRTVTSYSDVFNVWDSTGRGPFDLSLKNSQYVGQASDGGNLGADDTTVQLLTAGVAPTTGTFGGSVTYQSLLLQTTIHCGTAGGAMTPTNLIQNMTAVPPYGAITLGAAGSGASPWKKWTGVTGVPAGMTFDSNISVLSGTCPANGTYPIVVANVEDAGHQTTSGTVNLVVP